MWGGIIPFLFEKGFINARVGVLMSVYVSKSLEDTALLGRKIAEKIKDNDIIAYFGGMGMGKTTLTRSIVEAMGGGDCVSSPTFAIVNEYHGKCSIYHFDMYRVNNWDDLYSTGFFDYLDNGIIIIEWSENIEPFLPEERINITIKRISDNEREIIIEGAEKL